MNSNMQLKSCDWLKGTAAAGALALALSAPWGIAPAMAQADASSSRFDEIIVTARKRQESVLKVPVVETVLTGEVLEQKLIVDIDDLAANVPGLSMGMGPLAIGPQISMRGIGTSSLDAGIDQSISLNVDGLSMSQGLAFKAALFDLAQAEVLKGPQALFFGKNSPAGVISLRSADPGDEMEIIAKYGYEFEAREHRAELIFSSPLSDTVGLRLAGMYSNMDGFFKNLAKAAPGTGARDPRKRAPTESYILRGTLVWEPDPSFQARLKVNFTKDDTQGNGGTGQLVSCPDGMGAPIPTLIFWSPLEDCKLNRTQFNVDLDPAAFRDVRNDGVAFITLTQKFGTLELAHEMDNGLTFTSVSGFYRADADSSINSTLSGFFASGAYADNVFHREEFTQEFRLDSDFAGPLNFSAGGFYQDGEVYNQVTLAGNNTIGLGGLFIKGFHRMKIESHSLFGQLRYKVAPDLEIAAGVRWTDEKRSDKGTDLSTGVPLDSPRTDPTISSSNFSPELSITYTPTDTLTFFASLKQGYKSGSYTITGPPVVAVDNDFGDERIRGGEIGMKSRLMDRQLALDLAGYYYKYSGMQVGVNVLDQDTGLSVIRTLNAGGAKIYGVEMELTYRPHAIDGLTLTSAANWNHSRFTNLIAPCWGGQTIAQGCNLDFSSAIGAFTSTDLSGTRLVRASDFTFNGGISYDMPAGDEMTLHFGLDGMYVSKYKALLGVRDDFIRPGHFTVDGNVSLAGADDRWEVALIGRNLTNKITAGACTSFNFANANFFGGLATGTDTLGPAGVAELNCVGRRGREAWVRLTLRK